MAEDSKIVISVEIAGVEKQLKSLKDIKQARKELTEAALFGDKAAAKSLADLNDRLEDVGDSVKTLKGSGIEKISGSFGQLGEGFKNLDTEKISTGFKGLGAAMKAVPIFLLVEGITYLITNFKELSEGTGPLAKALQFVGDIIGGLVQGLKYFADWLGISSFAAEEAAQKQVDSAKSVKEAITDRYDSEIKMAKATGKATEQIEIEKERAVRKSIDAQIKALNELGKVQGELTDKQKEDLKALNKSKEDSVITETGLRTKQYNDMVKSIQDAQSKESELAKERAEKLKARQEAERKILDEEHAYKLKQAKDEEAWQEASMQYLSDKDALIKKQSVDFAKEEADAKASIFTDTLIKAEATYKQDLEAAKLYEQQKTQSKQDGINAAKGLSDLYFMAELNHVKGNAAATLEIRKKQFQVDKAFRVAQAVQDGIAATLKAVANGGGVPFGIPFGIATGALASINIYKLLATKFDGGSVGSVDTGSASGSVSIPTGGAPINTTAPTTKSLSSTQFNEQGQNMNRVYVLESDISKSQSRVNKLDVQSTI